jgi:uncharacterized protein (TIGR02118 family)
MIKLVYCLTRKAGMSEEEFHRYWRDVHGPIAARIPGQRRYVQSHSVPNPLGANFPSYDGCAEIWYDSIEAMQEAFKSPEVRAAVEDERNFIDHTKVALFITEEAVIVGD